MRRRLSADFSRGNRGDSRHTTDWRTSTMSCVVGSKCAWCSKLFTLVLLLVSTICYCYCRYWMGIIYLDLGPSSRDKIREQLRAKMGGWVLMSGWMVGWLTERCESACESLFRPSQRASWNNQFRFIRFSASRMQIKSLKCDWLVENKLTHTANTLHFEMAK